MYNCTLKICLTLVIGCLPSKIVKLVFHPEMDLCLRFRLTSRCDPDGVTPIVRCMVITPLSVKHHTKIRIFTFSGRVARKMLSYKGRKKKKSICYIAFFKSYFNRCHPGDGTGNEKIVICLQITVKVR